MVDYEFYINDYLGSAIPEKAFSGVAAQARQWLQYLKNNYRVVSSGAEAEKLAMCAMAEALWRRQSGELVFPGKTGENKSLGRALYEKASIYLDIYRGVTQ